MNWDKTNPEHIARRAKVRASVRLARPEIDGLPSKGFNSKCNWKVIAEAFEALESAATTSATGAPLTILNQAIINFNPEVFAGPSGAPLRKLVFRAWVIWRTR